MEYIYQKQVLPADVQGVPVVLSVVDANGNSRTIGMATTNSMGTFGFNWTPDIAGAYTITASFGGSESYYKSAASTVFFAAEAATTVPTTTTQTGLATTADLMLYLAVGVVAIIIAIAIVGLLILRKHP